MCQRNHFASQRLRKILLQGNTEWEITEHDKFGILQLAIVYEYWKRPWAAENTSSKVDYK